MLPENEPGLMNPLVADRIWFETYVSNGSPFFHQCTIKAISAYQSVMDGQYKTSDQFAGFMVRTSHRRRQHASAVFSDAKHAIGRFLCR
jgi:hypothetical protein